MTNKEVIEELISLIEHCASMKEHKHHEPWESDVQALSFAIKAVRIVDIIEDCFKRDSNLMMDYDDWADVKEEAEND